MSKNRKIGDSPNDEGLIFSGTKQQLTKHSLRPFVLHRSNPGRPWASWRAETRRPRGRIDMQTTTDIWSDTRRDGSRGQARRQAHRRTHRQVDGRADSPTARKTGRQAGRHTHAHTLMHAPSTDAHTLSPDCLVFIGPNSLGSLLSCRRATCSRSHQLCDPIASPAGRAGMRKKEDAARHRGIRRDRPSQSERKNRRPSSAASAV